MRLVVAYTSCSCKRIALAPVRWRAIAAPSRRLHTRTTHRQELLPGKQQRSASGLECSDSDSRSRRQGFRWPKSSLSFAAAAAGGGLLAVSLNHQDNAEGNDAESGPRASSSAFENSSGSGSSSSSASSDPLRCLDPAAVFSSNDHLSDLPVSHLLRAYVVFLASSSSTLVDIAPSAIGFVETLRDSLPLGLGQLVWRAFLGVRPR